MNNECFPFHDAILVQLCFKISRRLNFEEKRLEIIPCAGRCTFEDALIERVERINALPLQLRVFVGDSIYQLCVFAFFHKCQASSAPLRAGAWSTPREQTGGCREYLITKSPFTEAFHEMLMLIAIVHDHIIRENTSSHRVADREIRSYRNLAHIHTQS